MQKLGFTEFRETFYYLLTEHPLISPEILVFYEKNFNNLLPDLYLYYSSSDSFSIKDSVQTFCLTTIYFNL